MAQTSGTFPQLNTRLRAMHAKRNTKRLPSSAAKWAPAPRVPGGLAAHRAAAHAKARSGQGG